jgi:hypothetical protein
MDRCHRCGWVSAIAGGSSYRAVATRYDKRDFVYRGTVDVATIRIWLRDPVL